MQEIILDINQKTVTMPIKWVKDFPSLWSVHDMPLTITYVEQVGVDSWESTYSVFNRQPLDHKTYIYIRTIGEYDVNEGEYYHIDWSAPGPVDYKIIQTFKNDSLVDSVYVYRIRLEPMNEEDFMVVLKGDKEILKALIDSEIQEHNGFICISN